MDNGYMSRDELEKMNFKKLGRGVSISRKVSIYGAKNITIGDNVRIDDFSVLASEKGRINIGSHIHIAAFNYLSGSGGLDIKDFTTISSRCSFYTSSDDYSGNSLIVPQEYKYRKISNGNITINKYSIIGTGTVILPNVIINEGVSIGALSLVTKSLEQWSIYCGIPVRKIKERNKKLLDYEADYLKEWENSND